MFLLSRSADRRLSLIVGLVLLFSLALPSTSIVAPVSAATTGALTPLSYSQTVLGDKPVAYWRLGDLSGTTAVDSSGNGYNATYFGGLKPGVRGPLVNDANSFAVSSPGTNPIASWANSANMPPQNSPRSFEAWIRTTSLGYNLLSYGSNGQNNGILFQLVTANCGSVNVESWGNGLQADFPSRLPVNDDAWHYVVATYDGTSVTAYVDGVSLGTKSSPVLLTTVVPSSFPLYIGSEFDGPVNNFVGTMAEVAVYSTALAPSQVAAHYTASGNVRPGPSTNVTKPYPKAVLANSPAVYYRLGEAGGPTACDASGNSHNGQYQAGVTFGGPGAIANDSDTAIQTSGQRGPAVSEPGSGGLPMGNAPRTLEFWFKTRVATLAHSNPVGYGANSQDNAFATGLQGTNTLAYGSRYDGLNWVTPHVIQDANWHYVAFSFGGGKTVTAYMDGLSLGPQDLVAAVNTMPEANGLEIGDLPQFGADDDPFDGSIDEVAVYPTALTSAQVAAHFSASGNGRFGTINRTFGKLESGVVAKLQPNGGVNLSQETATISWGDGSITQATLSSPPGNPSELDVAGAHQYWSPGRQRLIITVTNPQTGASQTFNGDAMVSSTYAGLGDSYSSGQGAGWPPDQAVPRNEGCDWTLYRDPSGILFQGSTDHINGARVPISGNQPCTTFGVTHPLTGDTCHRALTAYVEDVNRLLAIEGMTLRFAACSGAVVQDMYRSASSNHDTTDEHLREGEAAQINAVDPNVDPGVSLITLTIGGNNLGFANIAADCVKANLQLSSAVSPCLSHDQAFLSMLGYETTPGSPSDGEFTSRRNTGVQFANLPLTSMTKVIDQTDKLLDSSSSKQNLHDALVLLLRELKNWAPGARILILGYPHFFSRSGLPDGTEHFSTIEQLWVNNRIGLADNIIADAAYESGVADYVDVFNLFDESGSDDLSQPVGSWTIDPNSFQVAGCDNVRWINGVDVSNAVFGASPEDLHPNPCGHQAEWPHVQDIYKAPHWVVDTLSLGPGASHKTTVNVISGPGVDRVNFTATWLSGQLGFTLTDPNGNSYSPVQKGLVYATWDIPLVIPFKGVPGTWTLTTTNLTTGNLGVIRGAVTVTYDAIPFLPPAAEVSMAYLSCSGKNNFKVCTVQLTADVASNLKSQVQDYQWFADSGTPLGNGPTFTPPPTIAPRTPHTFVVKTLGTAGTYRITIATFNY